LEFLTSQTQQAHAELRGSMGNPEVPSESRSDPAPS